MNYQYAPGTSTTKPRSVLFVAPSAYVLGGLSSWLDYLVPSLSSRGWDARLGLVSGRKHHRPEPYLARHPFPDALTVHCNTDNPAGRRNALEQLLASVQPDIAVSVNIPDLFVAINHRRARGCSGTRAVMSVHGIDRHLYSDMQLYRRVLDGVVCVNRLACALSASRGGIPANRVLYAPCGAEIRAPCLKPMTDDRLIIVYSGRLETPQKRCLDLVPIVSRLHALGVPFRLDVVGDGPDFQSLQDAFGSDIAAGSVVMHGHVSASELHSRIYPAAHALIITSLWETGPIVAWEAMAHNLGVVSSRYIGSGLEAALVENKNCLLFDIGDTDVAASALASLWRSPQMRTTLQEGGARLLASRYSSEASVDAWHSALLQAIELPSMPPIGLPPQRKQGRLDNWFGVEHAQSLREKFGIRPPVANDPGGEWPHSHSNVQSDDAFWNLICQLDAGPDMSYMDSR